MPPQSGPPLHIHYSEDEIIYVLEGECEIECEGQSYKVLNGATAAFPKNSRHTFSNMGTIPCKVLVTIIPGGVERFFEEVSRLPTNQPPDIEQIKAIANKYNAEILTPQ